MTRDLSRLLHPRSIAIFGGGWAANVVEQLLKAEFAGEIWPVHPSRPNVHGIATVPNVVELPAPPDAAWVGVNRDTTVETVAALSAMGAGGAVCFASGFRETADGEARNAALLEAAGDMPIVGPNCYGLLNYLDGATLWPDQHGGARCERGVAIITQSSNIAINLTMQRRGLPLAYVLTAGNQAQLGLAELADGLLRDERVTAIGLHIEGIGDPAAFAQMADRARARKVPVIALPVGRSEQARLATVSHTASLSGDEVGMRAFFRRIGVPVLGGFPAFIEALKLLHLFGPLSGRDLLSVSCSGGEASLIADSAVGRDLRFRAYTEPERAAVSATLNSFVSVANPLDYHTFIWGDAAAMTRTFTAAMRPGFDLSCFVLDFPRGDRCSDASWTPAVDAISAAAHGAGARAAIVSVLPENIPEQWAEALMHQRIAPLCGIEDALAAAEAAAEIGEAWRGVPALPNLPASPVAQSPRLLDEAESKRMLADAGVAVPAGASVDSVERAVEASRSIGFPVALKALGIAHKSDCDALRLGLSSAEEVRAAAAALLTQGDALLVERMIDAPLVEMIVGVSRDPVYGLMLTIGAGGVLTELLADTSTLLLPSTRAEIASEIDSLRIARMIDGFRGRLAGDREALLDTVEAVARFAEAHADRLIEMEINPLLLCATGAFAADALIRLGEVSRP